MGNFLSLYSYSVLPRKTIEHLRPLALCVHLPEQVMLIQAKEAEAFTITFLPQHETGRANVITNACKYDANMQTISDQLSS